MWPITERFWWSSEYIIPDTHLNQKYNLERERELLLTMLIIM